MPQAQEDKPAERADDLHQDVVSERELALAAPRRSLLASFDRDDAKMFLVTFAATVTASIAAVMIVGVTGVLVRHVTEHQGSTGPAGSELGSKVAQTFHWEPWAWPIAGVLIIAGGLLRVAPRKLRPFLWVILALAAVGAIILILLALGLAAGLK